MYCSPFPPFSRDITEMKPQNGTAKCMLLGGFDPQKELTVQDLYFTHVRLSRDRLLFFHIEILRLPYKGHFK